MGGNFAKRVNLFTFWLRRVNKKEHYKQKMEGATGGERDATEGATYERGATGGATDEGGATAIAKDDSDDEEVTFSLTCEEIPGKRKGSIMYRTTDDHLWRINRKQSETKRFMYCYHSKITVDARVKKECNARGIMEMTAQRIVMSKPHNHEPDRELLDVLKLRQRVLTAAETSTVKLSHVFNDATRGQEGACRFGYQTINNSTILHNRSVVRQQFSQF